MAKVIPIFKGTSGINNKVDPASLKFSAETGISELQAGVNIEVSDAGRPSRRGGFTATVRTEAWHSLFSCGAFVLGIKGDALSVLKVDLSYTPIRNVHPNARMSYVRASDGTQDIIYYCNGYENGRVIGEVSRSWPVASPVGPAVTRKTFYAAPLGHLLEVYNLRMFIAEGSILWYSEPSSYSCYCLASNYFGFSSRLRMVQAVTGGLWISDCDAIYWLGGEIAPVSQKMPVQIKAAGYPAFEGTAVKAPASRIGVGDLEGVVIVFTTPKGICIGSRDGRLINITEHKLDLPSGLTGAGMYNDGKYTVTID